MTDKKLEEALNYADVNDATPEDIARIIRDFANDGISREQLVLMVKMIAMMRNTADLVAKWDQGKLRISGVDEDGYPMFDEMIGDDDDDEEDRPKWRLN